MDRDRLQRERVVLRRPEPTDAEEFLAAVDRSFTLHAQWVAPPSDLLAYAAYLRRIRQRNQFGFLVRRIDDGELVGVVNVNNVVFGGFGSGSLGYYAFRGQERKGLMSEAVTGVLEHAFGNLRLHRMEANIQPANAPSIALAKRCGFRLEGFSPAFLYIAGEWRDHERWAITAG
ncbi:MAG: GCN5-related N-acetyltransferase [Actinomycetia bacterium]|nr:GCN5-related N-acetyltransferase [Actinomycetes bacterium]